MCVARNGSEGNPVAFHVLVARKFSQFFRDLVPKEPSRVNRNAIRILKLVRHPMVHPQVQVAHAEDQRLISFREVECFLRENKAFLNGSREKQNMFGVAVTQDIGGENISLAGPRWEPGRRPGALDVQITAGTSAKYANPATQPSARCRGRRSRSSHARPPIPRRRPSRLPRARPRPGRWRRLLFRSPDLSGIASYIRSAAQSGRSRSNRVPGCDSAAAKHRADGRGPFPSIMILPAVLSILSRRKGSVFTSDSAACRYPAWTAFRFNSAALDLLLNCLWMARSTSRMSNDSRRATTPT